MWMDRWVKVIKVISKGGSRSLRSSVRVGQGH